MVEDVREEGFTRSNGRCSENRTDPVGPTTKCQSPSTRQIHDGAACARMACADARGCDSECARRMVADYRRPVEEWMFTWTETALIAARLDFPLSLISMNGNWLNLWPGCDEPWTGWRRCETADHERSDLGVVPDGVIRDMCACVCSERLPIIYH